MKPVITLLILIHSNFNFEKKILILQPERLHQRWQVRSIGRIIQKLLHLGNSKLIKFYGTRLFLIWYQILNKNRTHVEELMFQKLIQGFDTFHSSVQAGGGILNSSIGFDMLNAEAQKVFNHYDAGGASASFSANSNSSISIGRSIYPFELFPIIPIQPNEQQNTPSQQQQQQLAQQSTSNQSNVSNSIYNLTAEMLRKMLEYMQQDVMNNDSLNICCFFTIIMRRTLTFLDTSLFYVSERKA